jgi:hypothetical protein
LRYPQTQLWLPILLSGLLSGTLAGLTPSRASADDGYSFTTIDSTAEPDTVDRQYTYINNEGDLTESGVNGSHFYASIRYHNGDWISLTIPGGTDFLADNFNNLGQTSVYYLTAADNLAHTAIYDHGSITYVPDLAGNVNGGVWCINDSGTLTGEFANADGSVDEGYIQHGASTTLFAYPGSDVDQTVAAYINDSGEIVGFYSLTDGTTHGFIDNGGLFTPIVEPTGYQDGVAYGVNAEGDVVGEFFGGANPEGFLIHNGVTSILDFPDSSYTRLMSINDLGQITGLYKDAQGIRHAFLADPVPEPGSLALFAGLTAFGSACIRRRRK